MARSNPLTWRNIGQPSFGGQPGHETAARAFENASKGFRDAADFAQGRRTDIALSDLMSDGKIERGELGGLRGVDMKTVLGRHNPLVPSPRGSLRCHCRATA